MNSNSKTQKLFITSFGFFLILGFFLWLTLPLRPVSATHTSGLQPLSGYAWSSNIGWISFSSKNCDTNNDGQSDGAIPNCPSAGTPIAHYGVTRTISNGNLSGYAWAERIGWIKFDPSGPYPFAPNQFASLPSAGLATGWAQACAVFQTGCSGALRSSTELGNWDGWIKMSGPLYGVSLGGSDGCTLTGYAWGSDVIGAIHMSGTSYGVKVACTGGIVTSVSAETKLYPTAYRATPEPIISWTFIDRNGIPTNSKAYQVQITSPISWDSGKIVSDTLSVQIPSGILSYGVSYNYQVRAWDDAVSGTPSPFVLGTLTTPSARGPTIDFTTTPVTPIQGQDTIFNSTTVANGGKTISPSGYQWTFPSGFLPSAPSTAPYTGASETIKLMNTGPQSVTLWAIDSEGVSSQITKSITITNPRPIIEFNEVR
ncbi:MAG: hypothetical protein AAB362_00840 [Patescibacteria group bacterium]